MSFDLIHQQQIATEIIEHNPAMALRVVGPIGAWRIVFATHNALMFGYNREDLLAGTIGWQDIVHPEDLEFLYQQVAEKEEQGIDSYTLYYRLRKQNGENLWIADSTTVSRDATGTPVCYDCVITDHSIMRQAQLTIEDNLRQQTLLCEILHHLHGHNFEEALQSIFNKVGHYLGIHRILLFENEADNAGCFLAYEWSDTKYNLLLAKGGMHLSYEKDIPLLAPNQIFAGGMVLPYGIKALGSPQKLQREEIASSAIFPVYTADALYGFLCFEETTGQYSWQGDRMQFMENISLLVTTALVRKQSAQAVAKITQYDPLTGLTNRWRFDDCMQNAIAKARKNGKMGYVLFVDLDDFKILNDGFGHNYGDAMLVEVANFFTQRFKKEARVFRFGSDEFFLLVETAPPGGMQAMIDAILERGNQAWHVLDKSFYCTVSIGVVRFPDGNTGVKEIVRRADIALHQAKQQGKNKMAVYRKSANQEVVARAEMENQLRQAVRHCASHFVLHYQPLVTPQGKIVGAEALVRWKMPNDELLMPQHFIPLAETLGLIIPLGEYVFSTAAAVCEKINQTHPDFHISINVSVGQLQQGGFPSKVKLLLKNHHSDFSNLVLEITEGQAASDVQQMTHILSELRTTGLRISMDDFGTGYSSLSNMRQLPLDIIKIDRSFVQGLATDEYAKSFVKLMIELGHTTGRSICVEGVETKEQLAYCSGCGADFIQGFYFWRPMPLANLEELLG